MLEICDCAAVTLACWLRPGHLGDDDGRQGGQDDQHEQHFDEREGRLACGGEGRMVSWDGFGLNAGAKVF